MFHKITELKPLPNLRLWARFEGGDARLYDLAPLQERWDVFASLSTVPGLFALAHTDAGGRGVVWNDDIDLSSDEIWTNGVPA
ncbi:MAG: DUF2442 domain-containing protein [Oscillospiraceae bacterium]|nr:DUF2442 domain-containing protein [Oscillospiraceae bacterium]